MTGDFTAYCNEYYALTDLLNKRQQRLTDVLNNAPLYAGETRLSEVDAIISYYRNAQALKKKVDKTMDDMRATERIILMIMRHFDIPHNTILTGVMPGILEYEVWANENDTIYIKKTKDLAPEEDNPNIMTIQLWREGKGEEE